MNYSVEVPGIGYYENGTVLANSRSVVNFSRSVIVSSYSDQNKGIYLKTSSDEVTVIGQSTQGKDAWSYRRMTRDLDTFIVNEITDLHISEYEYFAVSVNNSCFTYRYNSSVLIVGTRNDTLLKLTVTQPITTRIGDANATTLIPGREYSFMINRLQTVYLSSTYDLTGTRIVTNKPVSVFSGHPLTAILWDNAPRAYLVEQMPPTALWGDVYYLIPFANQLGYAVNIIAANECVVNIHCTNFTNFNNTSVSLRRGNEFFVMFLNNETCTIWSVSKILVVQFSIGYQYYNGPMMTLVPPSVFYLSKIIFSTYMRNHDYSFYDDDYWSWTHYINIIVLAQYYQPDMIYLLTGGLKKSLDTQEWIPIKVNNITEAYGTTVYNISSVGISEIVHTNKAALMSVIVYGFTHGGVDGGYGTTANSFSFALGNLTL